MNFLKAFYFWTVFWILTVAYFLGLCFCKLYATLTGWERFDLFVHKYASSWGKMALKIVPTWRVDIIDKHNLQACDRGCVIVANHESMTDIWVLFTLGIQFRWLSKAEVFKIPIIGPAMRWAGYIPIKRGDKQSHIEALKASAEWIKRGVPMLFFPEGTRSETGEMRPFKIGAFKLADDCGVPVLPIVLSGTKDLIRKGSIVPGHARVKVKVLPVMYRVQGEDLQDYADRVRAEMLEHRSRM